MADEGAGTPARQAGQVSQVTVSIAGRSYRMACAPGEEDHLRGLARLVDAKIDTLRESFGEIGDQRLTVMAALTFADEAAEAERRLEAGSATRAAEEGRRDAETAGIAAALTDMAQRVEQIADDLAQAQAGNASLKRES